MQGIGLDDLRALFSFKTLKITIKQTPSAHLEVSKLDRGVEPSHKPLKKKKKKTTSVSPNMGFSSVPVQQRKGVPLNT